MTAAGLIWVVVPEALPPPCHFPTWINKSWGELAARCWSIGPIAAVDYVVPGPTKDSPEGQGSPGDPSSSKFQCCDLGTLSLCSLPNFVAEPAAARNNITRSD